MEDNTLVKSSFSAKGQVILLVDARISTSLAFDSGERIGGKNMAILKFDKEITALLVDYRVVFHLRDVEGFSNE